MIFLKYLFLIYIYFIQIQNECSDKEFIDVVKEIKTLNLTQFVEDVVIYHIELYIRQNVAPAFWKKFTNNINEQQGFEYFKSAVDGLYTSLTEFLPLLKRLEYLIQNETTQSITNGNNVLSRFKLIVRSTLLSQLPLHYEHIVEQFYKIAFNIFCSADGSAQGI